MAKVVRLIIETILRVLGVSKGERWFNFHLEFRNLVRQKTPAALGIEAFFPAYEEQVDVADGLLEQVRKSFLTGDIKTLDGLRDDCFAGFKTAVKAHLKSGNPARKKSAMRLMSVFDTYGDITRLDYGAESAALHNFLQDMNGKYKEDVKTLELTGFVTDLAQYNGQFTALVDERYTERTERPDQKLVEVRREVDTMYGDMIKVIEVFMLTNPDHGLEDFVKKLNLIIKNYKTLYKQEQGRKKSKSEEKSEE
jgi:hypothetical protein